MRVNDPAFRLRDQHFKPLFPPDLKTGLRLNTHHPVLKLRDYLAEGAAAPPAVSRPHPGVQWGMLANDRLGDCVVAMMLHSIVDWHLDAGTVVPMFTDEDAVAMYELIGGYNPSDPSSDQGCDEGVAMATWEKPGLNVGTGGGGPHVIAGTVAVDPANLEECRIAISEFVSLQIGIALPLTARGQSEWMVVGDGQSGGSAPGSWGGHGIPYREYDADTFKCVTWGSELLLAVPFHQAYAQEAHVVVSEEMLDKTGVGPSGVQWDQLLSDLKAFTPAR